MTEFFAAISQKQAALTTSNDWQEESYKGVGSGSPEADIDLKDAFDWLMGSSLEEAPEIDESVKQRRLDLLMWLMNLELRLSPYGEPA